MRAARSKIMAVVSGFVASLELDRNLLQRGNIPRSKNKYCIECKKFDIHLKSNSF